MFERLLHKKLAITWLWTNKCASFLTMPIGKAYIYESGYGVKQGQLESDRLASYVPRDLRPRNDRSQTRLGPNPFQAHII